MSNDVSEKLDILIKLQAAALTAPFEAVKDKILFLNKAGLRPVLIAEIVGTTPNHVNVTLSKPEYRDLLNVEWAKYFNDEESLPTRKASIESLPRNIIAELELMAVAS